MQASRPPYDSVDYPYMTQPATGKLHPPTRPAPSPTPSHFPSPQPGAAASRLPRTSSLLPPPRLVASASSSGPPSSSHGLPAAAAAGGFAEQTISTAPLVGHADSNNTVTSTYSTPNNRTFVNRWSASTGSSRSNSRSASQSSAVPRAGRQTSSVDTTFLLTSSPPSAKKSSRRLLKSRYPSGQYEHIADPATNESPPSSAHHQPYIGLPTFDPLPSLEQSVQDSTSAFNNHEEPLRSLNQPHLEPNGDAPESPTRPPPTPPAASTTMPYEQGQRPQGGHGHSRNRSGKSSADSAKNRGTKQPSQKATLSRALQKANWAVELDNQQDSPGARQAYAEACELLQQVLQRTTAAEDKQKLEAIRRTYTSRIDELDQMLPQQGNESRALPDVPDDHDHHRGLVGGDYERDGPSSMETATLASVRDDRGSPQPPPATSAPSQPWYQGTRSQEHPQSSLPIHPPEPGFLQSSFSRSPVRSRFPENALQAPRDAHQAPAHVSLAAQHPSGDHFGDNLDGPARTDFSMVSEPRSDSRTAFENVREDSQNSWLDPIDESGGSTASSVHSRTSSLGYRRRHIRAGSGDTEAEFDTALDAAIEAAYDDGYEPMDAEDYQQVDADDEVVANALRRVELARERVRQTGREAYEMASERERERFQLQPQRHHYQEQPDAIHETEGFFDDNSSEEEERMLEEMTRDYSVQAFSARDRPDKQSSVPRESDSSGLTSRTWHSSMGSNPPGTGATSLSTVTEAAVPGMPEGPAPAAPPPTHALPDIPPPRPPSSAKTVRNRRLEGHKQLKIETAKLDYSEPSGTDGVSQSKSTALSGQEALPPGEDVSRPTMVPRRQTSPIAEASPIDPRPLGSPFGHRPLPDGEDVPGGRSSSPSVSKLKKNFSSSSLRSLKSRNMSVSHLDETADMSPGTPSSTRAPAIPAIPTTVATSLREKTEASMGGMFLLDDSFHSPDNPGSPNQDRPDAPVSLEPCPTDFMLRPFWLMRCLYQTLVHPRGGYLSSKLFVPRDAWRVKGVKLKNVEDKIASCDFLTAALLKLARVDTCDADAMLEEMQSMEGVLEQTQASLSRRLGNEVGVQGAGNLFKEAPGGTDGDTSSSLPRSASVSGKASSFSWRRLRSKNSAAALSAHSRGAAIDGAKDTPGHSTIPITAQPTSKPARRDVGLAQFTGPNAHYMGSLARLFDAVQVIDQIARQVDDPGLRHADKTQVGLELCTRHAAEFFGFYICRFVLSDLGLLMDKYIKRGSEWVLA